MFGSMSWLVSFLPKSTLPVYVVMIVDVELVVMTYMLGVIVDAWVL